MRKILLVSLVAILAACRSGNHENSDLSRLIEKRDSLKKQIDQLREELDEVNQKITDLQQDSAALLYVSTIKVDPQTFDITLNFSGNVNARHAAQIMPEAQGKIIAINVREGDRVKKGQILISMDSELIKKNIEEVKTQLDLAKTVYEKQKALWEKNIGSEIQYLEAKNRKESLEDRYQSLLTQLDKYNVKAPFDGVVDEVYVKLGEMAGPTPLLRLVNLSGLYVESEISEDYIDEIKEGQPVIVESAIENKKITTRISSVSRFINKANRTFKIFIDLPEKAEFFPNQLVTINIVRNKIDSAIVLPSRVVLQDFQGNNFVYKISYDNNKTIAIKTPVKIAYEAKDNLLIAEGVIPGDVIIDKGSRMVEDKEQVIVKNN